MQGHINAIGRKTGCSLLKQAFEKYGIHNFKISLIVICFDESLNAIEIEYIRKYKSLAPNGYNILEGGHLSSGFKGKKHTEETKQKIKNNMPLKVWSKDEKENYSKKMLQYSDKIKQNQAASEKWQKAVREKRVGWCNGEKHKEETKQKISQSVKEYYSNNKHVAVDILKHREAMARAVGKSVEQLDKNTLEKINIFSSLREAARSINGTRYQIIQAIKNKTCGYGYRWNYV